MTCLVTVPCFLFREYCGDHYKSKLMIDYETEVFLERSHNAVMRNIFVWWCWWGRRPTESVASLLWKHRFTNALHPFLFTLSRSVGSRFVTSLCHQMSTTVENGMGGFSNTSREKTYKKVCEKTGTKNRTRVKLFLAWFNLSLVRLPELAWILFLHVTWEKSPQMLT